ncbi:hypothetical protein OF117_03965 [Geodermatophilus sp. YIM 151500]|uniref:TOPRIM nucleotidyl transferase/hydrolase domain-containing protein n=1 Tax=Geodermatophilus sp. YIM 151500 TaxID=2984531 RepID=UPI0021E39F44|nr:TOPRIM nucleotidyl transferase/hydrolase domain-containing protein [Geodermatophilus sp. YIM 151500]MCV2488510.1 hypothetical protein [Geodermatophilus sp. YIM 151500]
MDAFVRPSAADEQQRTAAGTSAVLVIEGDSDRAALEAVAVRRGRDLAGEGVRVLAVGGATNVRRFLVSGSSAGARVTVLCDRAEEAIVRRASAQVGPSGVEPAVFACVVDLEDELIRAAGAARVLDIVAAQGEDRSTAAGPLGPATHLTPTADAHGLTRAEIGPG